MAKIIAPKLPKAPTLKQVGGMPVTPGGNTPLSLPTQALTSLGPSGGSNAASVAATGAMATQAAQEPKAPQAPKGGIRKIKVRRKRTFPRFAGGFPVPGSGNAAV